MCLFLCYTFTKKLTFNKKLYLTLLTLNFKIMKKKNLESLKFNKQSISKLEREKVTGGGRDHTEGWFCKVYSFGACPM